MPQWAGSSWYFLRYVDNHNDKELASKEALKNGCQLIYMLVVLSTLYYIYFMLDFYTKFLYDIGVVDFDEPFTRLFNQGMITKNGAK